MKAARVTSLVILAGVLVGGLVLQAADEPAPESASAAPPVVAGTAIPAAAPPGTLSSTWYCAGGSATKNGVADHVLLIANPSDTACTATVTPIAGDFAPPAVIREDVETDGTTTTTAPTTTTTTAPTTTTTPPEPIAPTEVDLPAQSRVGGGAGGPGRRAVGRRHHRGGRRPGGRRAPGHQRRRRQGDRPLQHDGRDLVVVPLGRHRAGARELLVFMNPFPDDASLDVSFATDEGARDTLRFRNFVVPGRSVVGAYVDDPGGAERKEQVSAQVHVRSGRLVVDRIQIFGGDDDDDREGITVGLGAPVPAETWIFPDGRISDGAREQVVVYNPSDRVAEVEVEVRLVDPETNPAPEPFEVTVLPGRFSIVELPDPLAVEGEPPRVPLGVPHSSIVRSLNGVPITAERVTIASDGPTLGVSSTLGSPLMAPTWYFAGGGIIPDEREEVLTVFNGSTDGVTTFSVTAFADGEAQPLDGLQDIEIPAGGRTSVKLSGHTGLERLSLVVEGDGPIVAERGLYRIAGRGIAESIGIPWRWTWSSPIPSTASHRPVLCSRSMHTGELGVAMTATKGIAMDEAATG